MAATAVTAAPFEAKQIKERQASAVLAALGPVTASLQQLDATIQVLNPNPASAPPMLAASQGAMPLGVIGSMKIKSTVGGIVGMVQ